MLLGLDLCQLAFLLAWGEWRRVTPRYSTDTHKVIALIRCWRLERGVAKVPRARQPIGEHHWRYAIAIMARHGVAL